MTVFAGESLTNFDGVPFRILWDGEATAMATWSRASIVVENHIPGGNVTEVDMMGFGPWKRAFKLECEDRYVFNQLRALQQTEGTLRVPAAMNDLFDADVSEEMVGTSELYAKIENVLFVRLTDEVIQTDGVCIGTAEFWKDEADDV